jgi:apolipoprotein N-acyltransferase
MNRLNTFASFSFRKILPLHNSRGYNVHKNYFVVIFSILAGTLLTLAFAPFSHPFFAFISPLLLLTIWYFSNPTQAFWRGWFYGLGFFGTGAYWTYNSIHVYGNASIFLAFVIAYGLIAVLAIFPALVGFLLNKFFPTSTLTKYLLAFPITWVFFEWIRSWLLTGFPWLYIGNSQTPTIFKAIAPVFGVYGVSLVVTMLVGAIFLLIESAIKNGIEDLIVRKMLKIRAVSPRRKAGSYKVRICLLTIIFLVALCSCLNSIHWTKPISQPITVSLIQGNIPQEIKWNPEHTQKILAAYAKLTDATWNSKIIVWPEGAIPEFSWQAQNFIKDIATKAKQHKATIIFGVPIEGLGADEYYNGMLAVGMNDSKYLKRHLVPFGEYPMFGFITKAFMALLNIPMSNFTAGPDKQPQFLANNITIAPTICYEITYPEEFLDFFPAAQLILNISDDSWFGHSVAEYQQLEIAQMRSIETGRYQMIATNTGITAIINPDGTIQQQAPTFQTYILNGYIVPMTGSTPWIIFGKYIWLLLVFAMALLYLVLPHLKHKPR